MTTPSQPTPKIVCLCGSTQLEKAADRFNRENLDLRVQVVRLEEENACTRDDVRVSLVTDFEAQILELRAQRDIVLAQLAQWKKNYYDVADALTRESTGPEDLCKQARKLRDRLDQCREALEASQRLLQEQHSLLIAAHEHIDWTRSDAILEANETALQRLESEPR